MTMNLQVSLIHRSSIPQMNPLSFSLKPRIYMHSLQIFHSKRVTKMFSDLVSLNSRLLRHHLVVSCTLSDPVQENVNSVSESISSKLVENQQMIEFSNGAVSSKNSDGKEEADGKAKAGNVKKRLAVMVFFMGAFSSMKNGFERVLYSDWFSWWRFWRQEKRLDVLISEADANPQDTAKQSALLAELNKHSPESVIQRFEQRAHAVDSRGVVEYLRALVATNTIAEYLPDEQSGKPSSLPSLLQELKQRASGNTDEPLVSPGVSEKQPLHVMMVDPKISNRSSRFAQEVMSTILFTVAVGLMWYDLYLRWLSLVVQCLIFYLIEFIFDAIASFWLTWVERKESAVDWVKFRNFMSLPSPFLMHEQSMLGVGVVRVPRLLQLKLPN